MSLLINIPAGLQLSLPSFKNRLQRWCFPDSYIKFLTTTFLTHNKLWKKHCYLKSRANIANLMTQLFIFKISIVITGCISLISRKKSLNVVNNTPTNGIWRSLICQNFDADTSPLILKTDLTVIYALLSENVSFLECFWRSRIYFTKYANNTTETIF